MHLIRLVRARGSAPSPPDARMYREVCLPPWPGPKDSPGSVLDSLGPGPEGPPWEERSVAKCVCFDWHGPEGPTPGPQDLTRSVFYSLGPGLRHRPLGPKDLSERVLISFARAGWGPRIYGELFAIRSGPHDVTGKWSLFA
jgi:hypothetical protein